MTRLCRSRSISRASQDRRRNRTPCQNLTDTLELTNTIDWGRQISAHREIVHQTRQCLRRRFSEERFRLRPDAAFPSR